MKTSIIVIVLWLSIIIVAVVGEAKCIFKMVNCDWNPIGKSEVIYTAAAFTGLGSVVGYLDIKDQK